MLPWISPLVSQISLLFIHPLFIPPSLPPVSEGKSGGEGRKCREHMGQTIACLILTGHTWLLLVPQRGPRTRFIYHDLQRDNFAPCSVFLWTPFLHFLPDFLWIIINLNCPLTLFHLLSLPLCWLLPVCPAAPMRWRACFYKNTTPSRPPLLSSIPKTTPHTTATTLSLGRQVSQHAPSPPPGTPSSHHQSFYLLRLVHGWYCWLQVVCYVAMCGQRADFVKHTPQSVQCVWVCVQWC